MKNINLKKNTILTILVKFNFDIRVYLILGIYFILILKQITIYYHYDVIIQYSRHYTTSPLDPSTVDISTNICYDFIVPIIDLFEFIHII